MIVGFAQASEDHDHALVALVDHNLGGQRKDLWIAGDLDTVVASWRSASPDGVRVEEQPIDSGLGRLRDALLATDHWTGDTSFRSEQVAETSALAWARLRRAGFGPETASEPARPSPAERDAIVAEFLASQPGRAARVALGDADVASVAHRLVDVRADADGSPLRWSPFVVSLLPPDLQAQPVVLHAFVRFADERAGLTSEAVAETRRAIEYFAPAQPRAAHATSRRAEAAAAPDDVVESARQAPVLDRFRTLAEFYGDGRKLTQTGHATLADARALVRLLGTADRVDETIGDRTFKTKSAAELRELTFTIRWALSTGVLRKERGKLRATATWRRLDGKPLEQWAKAADALRSLGPVGALDAHTRYRDPDEVIDELVPDVLAMLHDEPVPFEEVLDLVCREADELYVWTNPYHEDPEHRRSSLRHDLDTLARILGWAGVVDRVGATVEPDPWIPQTERLVGGSLRLTLVGRWWLAR